MSIEITKDQLITIYNALEGIDKLDIEFDNYKIVHDLALNRAALAPHIEAIKMLDRPCADYRRYQSELAKLRNKHSDDHQKLKVKTEELKNQKKYIEAIDKEIERREKFQDELDKKITVENIKLLPRYDENGNPTIRCKGSKEIGFLFKIEPLFEPAKEQVRESK